MRPKLSAAYDREISDAEKFTDRGYESRGSGQPVSECDARLVEESAGGGRPAPGGMGFRPLKPIAVEQFRLEFRSGSHDQKFSFYCEFCLCGMGRTGLWAEVERRSGRSRG